MPNKQRDRLTEPYFTTRSKGTGLGLAIVRKIMEDHKGSLQLRDGKMGGACVTLCMSGPRIEKTEDESTLADPSEALQTSMDQVSK